MRRPSPRPLPSRHASRGRGLLTIPRLLLFLCLSSSSSGGGRYLFKKTRTGKWQKRWFETTGCFLTYVTVLPPRRCSVLPRPPDPASRPSARSSDPRSPRFQPTIGRWCGRCRRYYRSKRMTRLLAALNLVRRAPPTPRHAVLVRCLLRAGAWRERAISREQLRGSGGGMETERQGDGARTPLPPLPAPRSPARPLRRARRAAVLVVPSIEERRTPATCSPLRLRLRSAPASLSFSVFLSSSSRLQPQVGKIALVNKDEADPEDGACSPRVGGAGLADGPPSLSLGRLSVCSLSFLAWFLVGMFVGRGLVCLMLLPANQRRECRELAWACARVSLSGGALSGSSSAHMAWRVVSLRVSVARGSGAAVRRRRGVVFTRRPALCALPPPHPHHPLSRRAQRRMSAAFSRSRWATATIFSRSVGRRAARRWHRRCHRDDYLERR